MGGLYGAPRILQCIAQENVIPMLAFLGHGVSYPFFRIAVKPSPELKKPRFLCVCRVRWEMHETWGDEGSGSGIPCLGRKVMKWVVLWEKANIHLSVVLSLPVSCVHCLSSEPFLGVWHSAGAALLHHPSISLIPLCPLARGSLSCPCHQSFPVISPLPPSEPLLQGVPSRTGSYIITLSVGFFCKHFIHAGADPSHEHRKHLPLLCPPAQGRSLELLSQHLVK